ncbi:hypothetical protein PIROE2DRAFT_8474 [Piromyces sp. E2]|nr:hypothetical protein PIROE2DRAFT_8474 [Piromyces sp. E2]|eukprot:OUM64707.1 hypothetical protein PIROE2DRAFT_8474 [Piromyces sp. E2]
MQLRTVDPTMRWPFSEKNWLISNAIAHVFWLSGEILGDWYPLLRTKAVINNSKKIYPVYITCILFNLVKIFGISSFFIDYPINLKKVDKNFNAVRDIYKFNICWWSAVCATNVMSCMYDISVINALRSCLFNQLKQYKLYSQNPILEKFRQISELRIIISMLTAFLYLPLVATFTSFVIYEYSNNCYNKIINSDSEIEYFRKIVINFNYTLMYIDQILLRRYVDNNEKTVNSVILKSFDHSNIIGSYNHSTKNKKNLDQKCLDSSSTNPLMMKKSKPYRYDSHSSSSSPHNNNSTQTQNSMESSTYLYKDSTSYSLDLNSTPYDWLNYSNYETIEFTNNTDMNNINFDNINNNNGNGNDNDDTNNTNNNKGNTITKSDELNNNTHNNKIVNNYYNLQDNNNNHVYYKDIYDDNRNKKSKLLNMIQSDNYYNSEYTEDDSVKSKKYLKTLKKINHKH